MPARDRLDRLEFSDKAAALEHAVQMGAYSCPHCSHRVGFRTQNFRDHEGAKRSNLDPDWRIRFDAARQLDVSRWESFLDFSCPGCRAPVRVIYEPGEEYAMSAHSWCLLEVLEADEWL